MASRRGLVAANLVLLATLGVLSWAPWAGAQNAAAPAQGPAVSRARGDYTMIAGHAVSGGSSVVYILDSNNQELIALKWDQTSASMQGVGYRDLNTDATTKPGR
ncbi:MAG: hypothetical protein GC200_03080 [Tepidisphaera sp.]|nr:hypothetical protein [Tepidisphaera sp.]